MAVQKRMNWAAQKWVFLLSNSEKGGEDLKSVLKKISLERDSEDCLHCYSGSCFSPVDSKVPRLQGEPSPGLKLRSFELSDLMEMEVDRDCVWYHVISCPQQTPIHLPILINRNGVYIIVCHQADSSEDKLMYVKRLLDLIIDSTSGKCGSYAFIDGLDPKDFAHIEKYNSSTRKVLIFTLEEVEWDSFSHIAKIVSSHRSEDLVLSEKVFPILKDKDGRTRKPLVAYRPSDDEWKDEVCIESLQSLHRLGWIYLQHQTGLEWNLVFTSPKLFHDILKKIYEFRSSGKDVPNMIKNVYMSMRSINCSIEKFVIPFEELLLNLNLAVTVTLFNNMTVELVSSYSEVNIDKIPTSFAPLLVKFKNCSMTSQESFVRFAVDLENQTGIFMQIFEVALNCITFQGHAFNLYMCRRASTILEFRVEVSWHKDYLPRKVSTSDCFSVLKAIRKCASDSKYHFTLGFTCDLAKDNVDHAKICVDKFAKYESDGEIKLYCVAKGCCHQPYMQDQKVWFDESLQDLVPCSFDLLPYTQGRSILKVHHYTGPTAPRIVSRMDEKIGSSLEIVGVDAYRKGLIGEREMLGTVLGIEQDARAIVNKAGTIDAQLGEILSKYISKKYPTWRDFCTALKAYDGFNAVRHLIEKDYK